MRRKTKVQTLRSKLKIALQKKKLNYKLFFLNKKNKLIELKTSYVVTFLTQFKI